MSKVTTNLEVSEIQKGISLLGLKISESELNELKFGNTVSLEGRGLGEIGSVFILAEALGALNLIKKMTFQDLLEMVTDSCYSGIPIYCWNSACLNRCCVFLTSVDGKPAIKVSF